MSFVLDVSGDLATQSVGQQTGLLFAGVGAVLVLATLVAETLRWRQRGRPSAVIANLVSRIRAWWVMALVVGLALFFGRAGVIVLFAVISLFALREFITLAPTRSVTTTRCWPRSTSCCRGSTTWCGSTGTACTRC